MNDSVTIVGQGYVGLPLAVAAASAGWIVHGIEINPEKFETLSTSQSTVEDVDSSEIERLKNTGKYLVHNNFDSIRTSKIVVLCVPTPIDKANKPELVALSSACDATAEHIQPGALVINESTSFPGTLRDFIQPKFSHLPFSEELFFATAPERIDPGNSHWTLASTPRLVGGINRRSQELAVNFYQSFCSAVVSVSSPEVAEMAKLLENTFRLINIGFVNELSSLANALGIDVREVVDAAATKPYGFMPFYPSAGIGGHCIPVDPYYLLKTMKELDTVSSILTSAASVNIERPREILEHALRLGRSTVTSILIVGVAYKSGISDTREGSAEKIAELASNMGLKVFWQDALVSNWDYGTKWSGQPIDIAIVTTLQPGDGSIYEDISSPILDCTGKWKGKPNVYLI